MLLIATAVLTMSAPQPPPRPAGESAQATATIRIISGARLRLGEEPEATGSALRRSVIRIDGEARPARLIEFE
jgi:hypothetical protein